MAMASRSHPEPRLKGETMKGEPPRKKARIAESIPTPEEQSSDEDFDPEDHGSNASNSEQKASRQLASTPLTPSSPRRKFPSEQKTHHCPYDGCQKSFNRPARLADHLRSHTNERPFKCPYETCDKAFLRDTHLSHHVKSAHTGVREYDCQWPECQKSFLTATRLRRHQAVHEGQEKYRCTQHPPCNETFRKHGTLQRHITSVHLQQKPFPCTLLDPVTQQTCSQGFETAGKLRAHEGRIHGGLRFWCTECSPESSSGTQDIITSVDSPTSTSHGVGFPTYALLQSHLRIAHPPTCPTCQKSWSTRGELRQHLELHHSDPSNGISHPPRPHICSHPHCDKAFTKKGNLTVHERTVHSGARPFACCPDADLSASRDCAAWDPTRDSCGQAFKTRATLEEHVRNVHLHLGTRSKETPSSRHSRHHRPLPVGSTIDRLTGAAYDIDPTRPIACFFSFSSSYPTAACRHRFSREYDLDVHMQTQHGVSEQDIAALRLEREMLSGGQFWMGGDDGEDAEEQLEREEDEYRWILEAEREDGGDGEERAPFGYGDGDGGDDPEGIAIDPALLDLDETIG
ncbi:MAG: hypothetical protein M4579_004224 [Chaenotheca gracillima]|nr:MAG: hypothetical protein M4579_004224 [Chaenotheca gracillima]